MIPVVDTPDLTREQLFGIGLLAALSVVVGVSGVGPFSTLQNHNDLTYTEALGQCTFDTQESTYTAAGCTFSDIITNPRWEQMHFLVMGKWEGRGGFTAGNHRVEWTKDWIEGGDGLGVDASKLGYETDCESDPTNFAVVVCTDDKTAADKLSQHGDPFNPDGWEYGYDVRMPASALDRFSDASSCSGSITYQLEDDRGTATHSHNGNVIILDRRVACKIGTKNEGADGNRYLRITEGTFDYTVNSSVFAASEVSADTEDGSPSEDTTSDASGDTSDDDGTTQIDDDGATGDGSGGEATDTTVISNVDTAIINAVSDLINTVAGIFGA